MEIPKRAYSANLTDYQFRLLALMCHLAGAKGGFKTSVAELGTRTDKKSDKTVRVALKALEEAGLITKTRTRREKIKGNTTICSLITRISHI